MAKIDLAAQFKGHEDVVNLLRALAYDCQGRKEQSVESLQEYVGLGNHGNPQWALNWAYFERVASRCRSQQH